jgi:hypothetical protein
MLSAHGNDVARRDHSETWFDLRWGALRLGAKKTMVFPAGGYTTPTICFRSLGLICYQNVAAVSRCLSTGISAVGPYTRLPKPTSLPSAQRRPDCEKDSILPASGTARVRRRYALRCPCSIRYAFDQSLRPLRCNRKAAPGAIWTAVAETLSGMRGSVGSGSRAISSSGCVSIRHLSDRIYEATAQDEGSRHFAANKVRL